MLLSIILFWIIAAPHLDSPQQLLPLDPDKCKGLDGKSGVGELELPGEKELALSGICVAFQENRNVSN